MNFFLGIRHWQFFLLAFVLPFVLYVTALLPLFAGNKEEDDLIISLLFVITVSIGLFMNTGWQYAIGTNLHKRLPADNPMPLKRFKWFLAIPVIYIAFVLLVFLPLLLTNVDPESLDGIDPITMSTMALLIIPLHLFSMFCMFYTLYYNAKSLKAVASQRPVTFSEFAGEFFLMWFLPVGIWIIQPRINKIFTEDHYDQNFSFMNDQDHTSF